MKTLGMIHLILLTLFSSAAMAHHGPASIDHFVEHLLLILAIGLPLFYGFKRLLANRKRDKHR
jgi:flagellar biogenesis protein FliO